MIKILHFISDSNVGGAGKLLCNQIKNFDEKRFKVFVALPRDSALIKELKGLPCKIIKCKYGADRSFDICAAAEAHAIIKALKPDVVHSHASFSSRIAATLARVPSRIVTRHCAFPLPRYMKNPIIKGIVRITTDALSSKVIAVAEVARQELIDMGTDEKMITAVINGAEPIRLIGESEKDFLRAKLGLTKTDFVVTMLARLEEYKGHATLLNAAALCLRESPDFKFIIAGEGSQKEAIASLAKELGIEKHVQLLGFCEDVAPVLNITDVNASCSYLSETSSLSLCEGMSLGIPCVASDCGGNTYMVKNGENGLLYPAKNADALAERLIRLKRDKELYTRCSAGAYKRYREEFTAKRMSEKMAEIYSEEYYKSQKISPRLKYIANR